MNNNLVSKTITTIVSLIFTGCHAIVSSCQTKISLVNTYKANVIQQETVLEDY